MRVLSIGALTHGLDGERLAGMRALRDAGCIAVGNARAPIANSEVLRRAMEYAASFGLAVHLHAEDPFLRNAGVAHEGAVATRLGLPPIPAAAETVAVSRALLLAEQTGNAAMLDDAPDVLGNGMSDNFAVARKSDKTGYWVVAQVSRGEAQAAGRTTLWFFWGALALTAVGLGFGLMWMMRRWVAQPLASLQNAVGAIAEGDLSQPVSSERQDEIGALIRDTEGMRQRLAQTIGTVRYSGWSGSATLYVLISAYTGERRATSIQSSGMPARRAASATAGSFGSRNTLRCAS